MPGPSTGLGHLLPGNRTRGYSRKTGHLRYPQTVAQENSPWSLKQQLQFIREMWDSATIILVISRYIDDALSRKGRRDPLQSFFTNANISRQNNDICIYRFWRRVQIHCEDHSGCGLSSFFSTEIVRNNSLGSQYDELYELHRPNVENSGLTLKDIGIDDISYSTAFANPLSRPLVFRTAKAPSCRILKTRR